MATRCFRDRGKKVAQNLWKAVLALLAVFTLVGCVPAAKVNPESAKLAPQLPIADLHFHPGTSPSEMKEWMDGNSVRWAGAGVGRPRRNESRSAILAFSKVLGERFIAFAGEQELNRAYREGSAAAMEDANNPIVRELLQSAEMDLKEGRVKGLGEIFVNNINNIRAEHPRKVRADAPSIRALYELVAKYNAFLTFHMEADADSVAQMERLLASNRSGRILWNHCGSDSTVDQVRSLMARHPNLFCEFAVRHPPRLSERVASRYPTRRIFDSRGPDADWLKLIEDFPDRFMIGSDARDGSEYDEAIRTVRTGLLPYLRPSTARKVAYENAQRLFGLK